MVRKKSDLSDEEKSQKRRQYVRDYSRRYFSNPEIYTKHKKNVRQYQKETNQEAKMTVFRHYSKEISNSEIPICACCGYDDIRFLSLDHIDGRTNVSTKEKKLVSGALWKFVIKQKFPKGYQILCHNCNIAKGRGKFCPHQLDKMNKVKE